MKELKRNPKDRGFGYKKACEYPESKYYLFYQGEVIDSSPNGEEAHRLAREYTIAFKSEILIELFNYDVEQVKEYYLNQGAFHLDFPDCESWTDWEWLDTAETSDLILN